MHWPVEDTEQNGSSGIAPEAALSSSDTMPPIRAGRRPFPHPADPQKKTDGNLQSGHTKMQSIAAHALPYDDAFCEVPAFGVCGKRNQNLRISPHAANAIESTQPDPDIPGLGSDLVGTGIQIFLPT